MRQERGGSQSEPPPGAEDDSAVRFLRQVIGALTVHDADTLNRLRQAIDSGVPESWQTATDDARCLHRLLGALLKETERNLRLWRKVMGLRSPGTYGRISL